MKVKFGSIITDGRGKLGGHCASNNIGGAYLRSKVSPTNFSTSSQLGVRNNFLTQIRAWQLLTESQRNDWNNAVGSFLSTNIFGDSLRPTGQNLFVRINANLAEIEASPLLLPPLPVPVIAPISLMLAAFAPPTVLFLEWEGSPVPADTPWVVRMSRPVSVGLNSMKRQLYSVETMRDTGSGYTLDTPYVDKFGDISIGQKVFIEVVAVSSVTGLKANPVTGFAVVES